jgi:hypothetical protein
MFASRAANTKPDDIPSTRERAYPLENSERIRLKFGSYGIEVLENSPGIRVSRLHSKHDGVNVSRTFAVVAYPKVIEPEFRTEHDAIINGQSIGILFKKNGWVIDKHHLYFGEIEVPPALFSSSAHSGSTSTVMSAIHAYSLIIRKDHSEFQYASIAEVHHPEFLNLQDLSEIYGSEFAQHRDKNGSVGKFLDIVESRILAL